MPQQNETNRVTVDYYDLLSGGAASLTTEVWQSIMKTVSAWITDPEDREVAARTIADILFDISGEWAGKRTRIISKARERSDGPKRRSDFCLNAIKEEITEAIRKPEEDDNPELDQVRRQVLDHLRGLRTRRILLSFKIRTSRGRDICVMWGLVTWEPGAKDRRPTFISRKLEPQMNASAVNFSCQGTRVLFIVLVAPTPAALVVAVIAVSFRQSRSRLGPHPRPVVERCGHPKASVLPAHRPA